MRRAHLFSVSFSLALSISADVFGFGALCALTAALATFPKVPDWVFDRKLLSRC